MKKILNRVMAAAIAVPMVLTQGAVMNISAETTGTTAFTLKTFTAVPVDKTESVWNADLLSVVLNMEGTTKTIAKDDFLAILPASNSYATLLKEVMVNSADPVMTVKDSVVKIEGSADMTSYAESEIYSKIREALAENGFDGTVEMNEFNKVLEFSVTVDANALEKGKEVDANIKLTCDGEDIKTGTSDFFGAIADEMIASVKAQVKAYYDNKLAEAAGDAEAIAQIKAELEANYAKLSEGLSGAGVKFMNQLERAEKAFAKVSSIERTGSYNTADETIAAIAGFINDKENIYDVPTSVDEFVARHGNGFNKLVEIVNDTTATSGYTLNVTAADVAELAKTGSNFEVAISNGTYDVTFQIEDDQAAEVEAYVNKTNTEGKVYDSSYKVVEVKADVLGKAYYNVTRVITLKDAEVTTTTDVTTTSETTTTDVSTTTDESTTTEESTTTTEESTTTETSTTSETTSTETSSTPTETTTTETCTTETVPAEFVLESVEVTAGKGYYFSHDEEAFDLTSLVESLTLVGTLEGEAKTIEVSAEDFAGYLTTAYETPAAYYAAKGEAYVADVLGLTFTAPDGMKVAENADLTVTDEPMVYIGVKGDADLNGTVAVADATAVLVYYANSGAGLNAAFNADADRNVRAYFLADVNTESKAGADSDTGKMEVADATAILAYYAQSGAGMDADWSVIVG